jgi:tellurite resistance protein TerC
MHPVLMWLIFAAVVVIMFLIDLGVFKKDKHEITIREAIIWSIVWTLAALLFSGGVWLIQGPEKGLQFLTGYVLERALSVDNLFVFILVFSFFNVNRTEQRTALYWGIIGALIFRAIFIIMGVSLVNKFHWILWVFGVVLIISGAKLFKKEEPEIDLEKNWILKLSKRFFPVSHEPSQNRLFIRKDDKTYATYLFVVLLVIESTDIVFAVDSIPAVLAITTDPFIVYSSNVFAILGLRAMYFALAGIMKIFHHLHYGLAVILIFVGLKMIISEWVHISILWALGMIVFVLAASIVTSVIWPPSQEELPPA